MEYWVTWLIIAAIGLVVGLIVHAFMRFAKGPSLMVTLIAGIAGALLASFFLTPILAIQPNSVMATRYTWALIGGLVLSVITEMLFVGSRRGRVVTT